MVIESGNQKIHSLLISKNVRNWKLKNSFINSSNKSCNGKLKFEDLILAGGIVDNSCTMIKVGPLCKATKKKLDRLTHTDRNRRGEERVI